MSHDRDDIRLLSDHFESAVGVARAVERVELCDVLVREPEIEELRVLGDALAVGRLRDDRDAPLDAPAQQHLRGSGLVAPRDPRDRVAGEVTAGSKWAVGLQPIPLRAAPGLGVSIRQQAVDKYRFG